MSGKKKSLNTCPARKVSSETYMLVPGYKALEIMQKLKWGFPQIVSNENNVLSSKLHLSFECFCIAMLSFATPLRFLAGKSKKVGYGLVIFKNLITNHFKISQFL